MISYKQFIAEKFKLKQIIEKILKELDHNSFYIDMNVMFNEKRAISIKWFKEQAPIQIFQFRDIFEDRHSDKYILETKDETLKNIEYYIIKRETN